MACKKRLMFVVVSREVAVKVFEDLPPPGRYIFLPSERFSFWRR